MSGRAAAIEQRLASIRERQVRLQESIARVQESRARVTASLEAVKERRGEILAARSTRRQAMNEIGELMAKLAASEGKPGFSERAEAIRARIAELEASNGG